VEAGHILREPEGEIEDRTSVLLSCQTRKCPYRADARRSLTLWELKDRRAENFHSPDKIAAVFRCKPSDDNENARDLAVREDSIEIRHDTPGSLHNSETERFGAP